EPRLMDGNQRGGTSGIDGPTRTAQIQQIRDSIRRNAMYVPGGSVDVGRNIVRRVHQHIIAVTDSDKDARATSGQVRGNDAGVLQSMPCHAQQNTMLRV